MIYILIIIGILAVVIVLLIQKQKLMQQINNLMQMINNNQIKNEAQSQQFQKMMSDNNIVLDNRLSNYNQEALKIITTNIHEIEQQLTHQQDNHVLYQQQLLQRIAKLDITQQQIMGLNDSINNLEKVLSDKKARGSFGEARLELILTDILGTNKNIWDRQVTLKNNTIVDFLLYTPQPLGNIAIDSKFPLEGYINIINACDEIQLKTAQKEFEQHVIKHIKDINAKYIIPNITANQAIMFVPSETIFNEIYNYEKIINESYKQHVWICSPTTIMAILNLLLLILENIDQSNQAAQILTQLKTLDVEFERFNKRFMTLAKDFNKVAKDFEDINITANKLTNKFAKIKKVDFDEA